MFPRNNGRVQLNQSISMASYHGNRSSIVLPVNVNLLSSFAQEQTHFKYSTAPCHENTSAPWYLNRPPICSVQFVKVPLGSFPFCSFSQDHYFVPNFALLFSSFNFALAFLQFHSCIYIIISSLFRLVLVFRPCVKNLLCARSKCLLLVFARPTPHLPLSLRQNRYNQFKTLSTMNQQRNRK